MILSATLSKPVPNAAEILGKDFIRIKIKASAASSGENTYSAEFFTKTQVFHKKMTSEEFAEFLKAHAGTTFKNCVQKTETGEITILANKKGKITRLEKPLSSSKNDSKNKSEEKCGTRNIGKSDGGTFIPGVALCENKNRKKIISFPKEFPRLFWSGSA